MKRFALATCLAACLVFALGAPAGAIDQVKVASGAVGIGGSINIGIFIDNDATIVNWGAPLVIRTVSNGAYMTNLTFTHPNPGSPRSAFLTGVAVANTYPDYHFDVEPNCPAGTGFKGAGNVPLDFVSPDGVFFARQSVFPATPQPPGSDEGLGIPITILHFTVNNNVGFFEIDSACVTPANHVSFVTDLAVEVVPAFVKGMVEILANQCPAPSIANAVVNATVGVQASNTASGVDPESDPIQFFLESGPGAVNQSTGVWTWTPTCADVPGPYTVEIEVTDKGENGCGAPYATFTVNVAAPTLSINCGSNLSVHWGALAGKTITASGGCAPLIWEVQSGPGSIDGSGNWSYQTDCGDLGTQTVVIEAEDATGQIKTCSFDLTVTNVAPTCSDPADVTAPTGVPFQVVLGPASQGDGDALTYTLEPGAPAWVSVNGNLLEGTRPGGDDLPYNVCFSVSDGCQTSGICCVGVLFESPYIVCIKGLDTADNLVNYSTSLGGQNKTVCVWVDPATGSSGLEGGFDFLICYDQSALSFISAGRGADLHPDWEYFTYRTGMFGGNCGGACPNGFVRLVGIADMNNGVTPNPAAFDLAGCIANLTFFVTSDQNFVGSCPHVGFCSYDCGDNVISSKDGNTLFIASSGAILGPDYNLQACLAGGGPGKPTPEQFIDFCPGAICIIPPPDDRGDINFNGIPNEIGDAVLFSNYFIYGPSVFTVNPAGQAFATDVNNDGLTLTVADLVYLIRIITGDAQPFPDDNQNPKVAPNAGSVDVITDVRNGTLTISTNASVDLGGALLVYRFSDITVGDAALTAGDGLVMKSRVSNGELRILIAPDMTTSGGKVLAGANNLVTIPVSGEGTIELVESQFSDANGAVLSVESLKRLVPNSFALHQNFPNPFNAGTVIPISLTTESEWTLTIYNVAGQVVRTFAGANEAGVHNISWDGRANNDSEVPSGMYFYRLNTGEFTATKKMVLIK